MLKWFQKWNPKWNPEFSLFGFNFKMALKNRCQNHVKIHFAREIHFRADFSGFFVSWSLAGILYPGFFTPSRGDFVHVFFTSSRGFCVSCLGFSAQVGFSMPGFFMPVFFIIEQRSQKLWDP